MTTSSPGRQGLVQVYTGNGKGKTTAALGLALRAAGNGMRTFIGQFLKVRPSGETIALTRIGSDVTVEQFGVDGWVRVGDVTPEQRKAGQVGLARVREAMLGGEYDVVILDEINVALHFGVLTEQEILEFIDHKPPEVELVLTGRQAPPALLDRADLVTEMKEVRHPFQRGIQAREGIEF